MGLPAGSIAGIVYPFGALQTVRLTRSREAAKGKAQESVFGFRFWVLGFGEPRTGVGGCEVGGCGCPRVWVSAGSGGAAGWFDRGDSIAMWGVADG